MDYAIANLPSSSSAAVVVGVPPPSTGFKSFFPFGAMTLAHPLRLLEPEQLLVIDRMIVWFTCYREEKGYAKLPPPEGTCLELFLLIEQFQCVHGMLREQTSKWPISPLFQRINRRFLTECPAPPPLPETPEQAAAAAAAAAADAEKEKEKAAKKARREAAAVGGGSAMEDIEDDSDDDDKKICKEYADAIMLPQDHCPLWNPIHIPNRVFHEFKSTILAAHLQSVAARAWRAELSRE